MVSSDYGRGPAAQLRDHVVTFGNKILGREETDAALEQRRERPQRLVLGRQLGNPERTRIKHLENLRTPALIVQGTRDSFGRPDDIAHYRLSQKIRMVWVEDGDHSFKPTKRSGRTEAQNLADVISQVQRFIVGLKLQTGPL